MRSTSDGDPLTKPERIDRPSHAAKVSELLQKGVSLTGECSDVDGLEAIIGALSHVQTGR